MNYRYAMCGYKCERTYLNDTFEGDRHLLWVQTDVRVSDSDSDSDDVGVLVGSGRFAIVLAGDAYNKGRNIVDELDAVDQEMYDLASFIYDDSKEEYFSERLERWLGPASDVMYVQSVWVEPDHRGHNIEGLMIDNMFRVFGHGCDAIVLRCVPFGGSLDGGFEPTGSKDGFGRLLKYYKRLGFVRVKRTEWMIADRLEIDAES